MGKDLSVQQNHEDERTDGFDIFPRKGKVWLHDCYDEDNLWKLDEKEAVKHIKEIIDALNFIHSDALPYVLAKRDLGGLLFSAEGNIENNESETDEINHGL